MKLATTPCTPLLVIIAVLCGATSSDARLAGGGIDRGTAHLAVRRITRLAGDRTVGVNAPMLVHSSAQLDHSEAADPATAPAAAPGAAGGRERSHAEDETDIRPHEGGEADVIEYGILVKGVKAVKMGQGSFRADLVLTMRWTDPRTKSLVPAGAKQHTLSPEVSQDKMWMPDITVSNRKIGGAEVISSAITVDMNGNVTKTERLIVVCTNKFTLGSFPFDTQVLKVRVASTTMMRDELVLTPIKDKALMGIRDKVFDGMDISLKSTRAGVVDEVDGSLRKSRGELDIEVTRDAKIYLRKKLLPELFLVAISWTVFYFPLKPPFAMPRVATSLISYLSFTALAGKTSPGMGQTWFDIFEESVIISLFLTVFLNIFVEIVNHSLDRPRIAERIDYELKFLLPGMAIVTFAILFSCIHCGVGFLSIATRIVSSFGPIIYFAVCWYRYPDIKEALKEYHNKVTQIPPEASDDDDEHK